jgi:integrase
MPRKKKEQEPDKKRTNGTGGVYKLPDGRFRWQVTVGYRDGKQVRASGIEPDRTKAMLAAANAVTDFNRGVLAMPDRVTVADYAERWLKRQKHWATSSRLKYERYVRYILEHLGKSKIQSIRPHHIKDMLSSLADKTMTKGLGKDRLMSSSTLSGVRTAVRAVFKEAHHDGLINVNPADRVKRVKPLKTEHPGIALDFDETARFHELGEALHMAGRSRLWPALFTCVSIGLRRGEVMALRWCDLDLEKGLLMVRQSIGMPDGKAEIRGTKNESSSRDILMPASLKAMLIRHRDLMVIEAGAFNQSLRPTGPVFGTVEDKYTHPDNLSRALGVLLEWSDPTCETKSTKKVKSRRDSQAPTLERRLRGIPREHRARLEAAILAGEKLPEISPHDLRHTAGTLMLRRKVPVEVVSKTLGHADITMTYRVYRHVLESEKREHVIDLFSEPVPSRVMQAVPLN